MENSKDMAQHTYDNEAVQELLKQRIIQLKDIRSINVLQLLMVNRIWNR